MSTFGLWGMLTIARLNSKIPVPEVFAYDIDPGNDIGAPYMLIEYMHGTTASELRRINESEPATYGDYPPRPKVP